MVEDRWCGVIAGSTRSLGQSGRREVKAGTWGDNGESPLVVVVRANNQITDKNIPCSIAGQRW